MSVKTLSEKELYPFKGLWHGISVQNFMKYLEQGFMEARTTHRYWKGGHSFQENHPEYNNSTYMKGWSFTRNRQFAFAWSDITLLVDIDLIKQDFKVLPISWTARRNAERCHKIELEEFVFSNFENKTELEVQDEYSEVMHSLKGEERKAFLSEYPDWIDYLHKAGKRQIDIMKYVKGFFIADDLVELYVEEINYLKKHPLFKGFYDMTSSQKHSGYKSLCFIKEELKIA